MLIIRPAKPEDELKISKLIAQFRVELKQLKGIKSMTNLEQAVIKFKEYIEANFPLFVAEDNRNELLGYLVCRIDQDVVWAESLFVSQDFRKKGIGSKLYAKAEQSAEELGNDTVYNWVQPNNDKIIPFLKNRGYNVLNLIELRKSYKNEVLTQKITIGDYEYNY